MLRPHFHALSISLAINATCKLLKGSQDSPGALSSVSSVISISGKTQVLLWWQPAGINHTFIGDGGMSAFPERPNSSPVETETAISRKCQRKGVCMRCLKALGIWRLDSRLCHPEFRFQTQTFVVRIPHRTHREERLPYSSECSHAECRSKYAPTPLLKMLVRMFPLLFSSEDIFLLYSVNKTVHPRNS